MIGFVVPFKGKNKSKDWVHDCGLLGTTLRSICRQTDPGFKIFVVYTDMPVNHYENIHISYIKFPYAFCTNEDLIRDKANSDLPNEITIDERMFDQGKRIMYGCMFAKKHLCHFIMPVDADDLVSNRIAEYINQNNLEHYGWFVNKGYILNGERKLLMKVKKNMNNINGSTNIVNVKLIPEVNFSSNLFSEFSFFSAHAYLKNRLFYLYQDTLKPLPFYGVIYRLHNYNWTGYKSVLKKQFFRTLVKYLLRGKIMTLNIREEFGVNLKND